MRILHDHDGLAIRLTSERIDHIADHLEMRSMRDAIGETVLHPQHVVQSLSDPEARLYYRYHSGTLVGDKLLCVVVGVTAEDAFVLTAYLTDRIKRGVYLWPGRK